MYMHKHTQTLVLAFLEDIALGDILCLDTIHYNKLKHTFMTLTEPQRFYAGETGTDSHSLAHDSDSV